jgi:enoyl-CoA hydratase
MLIDRDRKPQWRPATLAEVADSTVDAYFAPIGDRELRFA